MRRPVPQYVPPLLIAVVIGVLVALFDWTMQARFQAQERADVVHRLSAVRARLEGELNSRLFLTQGLVSYVATHPEVSHAEFNALARGLIAGHSGIDSIQLARNTVVSDVYPLKGNRAVLGLRLLDLPGQRAAVQRALDTRGTVVAGPLHLVQGGLAFVARTPIYLTPVGGRPGSGPYWGLATIIIDAHALLRKAGLAEPSDGALRFALRGKDGLGAAGEVFFGNGAVFHQQPALMSVDFPNGSWQLAAVPRDGWQALAPDSWWWRLAGTLLVLLGAMLAWLWARYPDHLWREVQRATGALRRAQQELEAKVAERTAELTAANQVLREREAQLAEAQQIARMGSWLWDVPTSAITWSDEVYRILGYRPGEVAASYGAFLSRVHPDDRDAVENAVKVALQRIEPYSVDHRILLPDGTLRIVHEEARVHYDAEGNPLRMTGTVHDITEAKAIERQLEHMAYHDSLTGLPNRALLRDRLAQAIARSRRTGRLMALLFLDLDRFKNVNDSLGHGTGDRLLVQVAERLAAHMRTEDTLARLGGDEFTVLLEDLVDTDQAAAVARKLHQALSESFHIDGHEIFVAGSVGISLYPGDGDDVDTLMKHADAAMYRAKELGRGGDQFFSRDLGERAHEHLAMEMALRRGLDRSELCLHYQPIVELASGRIAGFEALVRWYHPERGLLAPGEFIPLAEETGLCVDIGRYVLRSACEQSRAWRDAGVPPLRVMVNLSPRQFSEGDLSGEIKALLQANALQGQCIGLEITEHVLVKDDDVMNHQLRRLREMGVPVAIDDFGKGHSSLAYLKRLAIATLKIDRAFVRDVTTDPNDTAIVEAIIAVAHTLDLDVVAEGVETAAQAESLRTRGCDFAQGFYYSRPVPAEQVPALIEFRGVAPGCGRCDDQDLCTAS